MNYHPFLDATSTTMGRPEPRESRPARKRRLRPNPWPPVIPGEAEQQVVAWAVERANGGRGFGYTGGQFHANWGVEPVRKMVLNAILWTAKADVPEGGVASSSHPKRSRSTD